MGGRRLAVPVAVLVGVLAVFVGLAAACRVLYDQTEDRLLRQRTAEASSVLRVNVSQIQASFEVGAKIAAGTDGDVAAVEPTLRAYLPPTGLYSSAALFRIDSTAPLAQFGEPLGLATRDGGVDALLRDVRKRAFVIVDLLDSNRRLGYAVSDDADDPSYVVYVERTLSADPYVRRQTDESFAQLDYAIYFGDTERPEAILGASVRDLPIGGRRYSTSIPFGDSQLLLVMTPIGHLSGDLFAHLWWMVGLGGFVLACAFAALAARWQRQRDLAVDLAADNERLYDDQRQIAETLQLSLLPQHLDTPTGSQVAARYWPAGAANLIGGDFYDVFQIDDRRWGVTIGDVCGKGIAAATLTGLARHTLRAASRQTTSPAEVLHSLHLALGDHRPPTFCTACFAFVTIDADGSQQVDLSLGGHPAPLLRRRDGAVEEIGRPGTILGMIEPELHDVHTTVSAGDVLVLYTDGLTDAPGDEAVPMDEVTDLLHREGGGPIEQLADSIRGLKRRRRPRGSGDDTALLVVGFGHLATPTPGGEAADESRSISA